MNSSMIVVVTPFGRRRLAQIGHLRQYGQSGAPRNHLAYLAAPATTRSERPSLSWIELVKHPTRASGSCPRNRIGNDRPFRRARIWRALTSTPERAVRPRPLLRYVGRLRPRSENRGPVCPTGLPDGEIVQIRPEGSGVDDVLHELGGHLRRGIAKLKVRSTHLLEQNGPMGGMEMRLPARPRGWRIH